MEAILIAAMSVAFVAMLESLSEGKVGGATFGVAIMALIGLLFAGMVNFVEWMIGQ